MPPPIDAGRYWLKFRLRRQCSQAARPWTPGRATTAKFCDLTDFFRPDPLTCHGRSRGYAGAGGRTTALAEPGSADTSSRAALPTRRTSPAPVERTTTKKRLARGLPGPPHRGGDNGARTAAAQDHHGRRYGVDPGRLLPRGGGGRRRTLARGARAPEGARRERIRDSELRMPGRASSGVSRRSNAPDAAGSRGAAIRGVPLPRARANVAEPAAPARRRPRRSRAARRRPSPPAGRSALATDIRPRPPPRAALR